jgi:hypothetical protein
MARTIVAKDAAFSWTNSTESNAFFVPPGYFGPLTFEMGFKENAVWTLKRYIGSYATTMSQTTTALLPGATTNWEILYEPHTTVPTTINTLGQGAGSTKMTFVVDQPIGPGWYRWSSSVAGPGAPKACRVVYAVPPDTDVA